MAPANLCSGRAECEGEHCRKEKEGHVSCEGSLSLTRQKCVAAAARLKVVDLRKVALKGGFSLQ